MNGLYRRLGYVAIALSFCAVYGACYVYFLNAWFEYAGFYWFLRAASFWAVTVVFAVLPVLAYGGQRAISSAVAVFIYLLLYIPTVLTFTFASVRTLGDILIVQAVLMLCMCGLFLADRVIIRNPFELRLGVDLAPWVFGLTVAGIVYLFTIYRGHFALSSFGAEVYVQRAATAELGTGLITRYASSWLNSFLIPICLSYGLVEKRLTYFVAGSVGCVIVYLAVAAKIAILLPVIYVGLFVLLRRGRLCALLPLISVTLSVILLALLAFTRDYGGVPFLVSSLLMHRTIGSGGQITLAYYEFFQTHPQTLYTHVHGIKEITGAYPYGGLELGQVVGQFYFSDDTNANANFWATDGFAALGVPGLVLATVGVVVLLMVLNSVTQRYDRLFAFFCLVPLVLWLLNVSLFTSVWSGGALFLIAFFLLNGQSDSPELTTAQGQRGEPPPPTLYHLAPDADHGSVERRGNARRFGIDPR